MMKRTGLFLALLLAALWLGPAPARADYLEDIRTARGVSWQSPRAPLAECLKVLSDAVGVTLTAAPTLGDEPLIGYVPKRPLRETMGALADLYDGTWTVIPGAAPAYRLDPDPARAKAAAAARVALMKSLRKQLDDQATETERRIKTDTMLNSGKEQQWHAFAALLWGALRPADRDRVLNGTTVTVSISEEAARPIYELMLAISEKQPGKLTGPLLASFDLDNRPDSSGTIVRARATAMRENSCVGAIGVLELALPKPAPRAAAIPADDPALPADIGDSGRVSGERDQVLVKLARATGIPILSRHPVTLPNKGGRTVNAGGRKLSEVMTELATACDATVHASSRGYQLLRSNTEALDRLGVPDPAAVRNYLAKRPRTGTVPFATVAQLTPLTPLQLVTLASDYRCSDDAQKAMEMFAVLRFYQSLTPEQRQALFSSKGLAATTLTHEQIHQFLDEKAKRAGFDIHDQLQALKGLTFRFREEVQEQQYVLQLDTFRDVESKTHATQSLPKVDEEEGPTAQR